jgi:hypothetical protein
MDQILTGMYVMGYAIGGLFFLRFWRVTKDRLFLLFAIAFWILGLQRLLLGITTQGDEDHVYLYSIRLVGFLVILWAIIDKNLQARRSSRK